MRGWQAAALVIVAALLGALSGSYFAASKTTVTETVTAAYTVTATETLVRTETSAMMFTVTKTVTVTETVTPPELLEEVEYLKAKVASLEETLTDLEKQASILREAYARIYAAVNSRLWWYASRHPKVLIEYIDFMHPDVSKAVDQALGSLSILPSSAYEKIYNWIESHIRYEYDPKYPSLPEDPLNGDVGWIGDYLQKASETIYYGRGDCEDLAVLTAAMVMNYWKRRAPDEFKPVYLIYLDGDPFDHVFTVIAEGNGKICLLDPAAHQVSGYDLIVWKIVRPEPAQEAIRDYLAAWKGVCEYKKATIIDAYTGEIVKQDLPIEALGLYLEELSK